MKIYIIRDPKTCPKNFNNEPTKEYNNMKEARKEAGRLAGNFQGVKFFIVKAVKCVWCEIQTTVHEDKE